MTHGKKVLGRLLLVAVVAMAPSCGRSPAELAKTYREKAEEYARQGKYKEAQIEFRAALQKLPRDADALYGLARALNAEGQPGGYRETLKKVVAVDPRHPKACVELGQLAWASGQFEEALTLARQGLRGDPNAREALRLEAQVLSSLGRLDEARAAWGRLMDSAASDEAVFVAAASFELASGREASAREALERGLRTHPRSARLLLAWADLLARLGDSSGAQAALREARAASPKDPEVYVGEARYLFQEGDLPGALDLLQRAQAAFKGDPGGSAVISLERARTLLAAGEAGRAELVLKLERSSNPKNREVGAALVGVLLRQGKIEEASPLIDALLDQAPDDRTTRLVEAEFYLLQGRSKWALDVLEQLVGKGDLSLETRFLYAKALAQEGRLGSARREYEAILARAPGHAFARLDLATVLREQRQYPLVLAHIEALPMGLKDSPWVQYLYARTLLEKGDVSTARRMALGFLDRAPKNLRLLTLVGEAERASGRPKEAEARYREAIAVAPGSWEPVAALVGLLEGQGRFAHARTAVEEFQRRNGEKPDALNRLASLALAQGDPAGALRWADRSMLVEPNYWASKFLRAKILLAAKQEPRAMVEFEEAIRLNPYRPDAYNQLAEIHRRKGDLGRAEEAYRRLLEKNPDDPLTSNNLAALYLEEGKVQDALPLARRAYEAAPGSPAVLDTVGWAMHLSGDPRRAQPLLDQARRLVPAEPEILLHWALNARALGRKEEALTALGEVVRLAPASRAATSARQALGKTVP